MLHTKLTLYIVTIILLEEKFLKGNPQFVNQEISNFKKYFVLFCIIFMHFVYYFGK